MLRTYRTPGENRFVVVNNFLKFGPAQFSGTRSVHSFKLNLNFAGTVSSKLCRSYSQTFYSLAALSSPCTIFEDLISNVQVNTQQKQSKVFSTKQKKIVVEMLKVKGSWEEKIEIIC